MPNSTERGIAVFHLARRKNGIGPLRRFLSSYATHAAGCEHSFIVILKGFERLVPDAVQQLLAQCQTLRLGDEGLDIESYFAAARSVSCRYVCFLNSYSVIRTERWLAILSSALRDAGVGIVGASGTWQSLKTNYELGSHRPLRDLPWALPRWLRYRLQLRDSFPDFPNAHVRTNAFVMERVRFLQLARPLRSKMDAYRFESGVRGLSRTLIDAGLQLRIAGANGQIYAPAQWRASQTFWSADQENLLVADNQSMLYQNADAQTRANLRRFAWGSAD